jgi:hypothetical protein
MSNAIRASGSRACIAFSIVALQWPQLMSGMWNVVTGTPLHSHWRPIRCGRKPSVVAEAIGGTG